MVFDGDTTAVAAFTQGVFNYDFAQALPLTVNKDLYTAADLKIIQDTCVAAPHRSL